VTEPAQGPDDRAQRGRDEALVTALQSHAIRYFLDEVGPHSGLVADSTMANAPCSVAAVGMALGVYPIAVERGFIRREDAVDRVGALLRFLQEAPQGPDPDATGYHGFYYHFLDIDSGRRVWQCELSTIDTALLLAGALVAAEYFDGDSAEEAGIGDLADALYRRVDWRWALNGADTIAHGWRPESGFLPHRWQGYDESLILYVLALGSPTHPIPPESYHARTATYDLRRIYGRDLVHSGPLFVHQYSHLWLDLRGVQDAPMRELGLDYFENSRRATLIHQEYAIRNPLGFTAYCDCCWGFTACHGPGPATHVVDGVERRFLGYAARGAPFGPDDGTIAPWVVVASLPFAPGIVLPTIRRFHDEHVRPEGRYGFDSTFNATYPGAADAEGGWFCPWNFAIDQGAIALMTENFRTGLLWRLTRRCPYVKRGLRLAAFTGGWLALG
jgi:hypothetical protein